MFSKSKIEIEKIKADKEIKLAMLEKCDRSSIKAVKTDSGLEALIQTEAIKSVMQEDTGWYKNDGKTETLLVKYIDETWERLDMLVKDFIDQTGFRVTKE